jgi:hypothetical protein
MTEKPKTIDGKCTNCGDPDMHLAKDITVYSPCQWNGTAWDTTYEHTEPSAADDAVRFFCTGCGTQHEVPEELTK